MKHFAVDQAVAAGQQDLWARTSQIRDQLNQMLSLVDDLAGPPATASRMSIADQKLTETRVREMLKSRRKREQCFGADLFADPAWDILLELYAAELGDRRMTISSLCIGAAVPATTALRWISLLETKGMVERRDDPLDGRRVFVSLTSDTLARLDQFFHSVPAAAVFV